VSYEVSCLFKKPSQTSEFSWRVLLNFNGGICLTIVYQHDSTNVMLILDKSSQDPFLRGKHLGTEISLFSSRGMSPALHVPIKSKQTIKSTAHSLYQRRWNAPHPCDRDRAIHKAIIQRSANWRVEIISGI
jgi:hypothetical protein